MSGEVAFGCAISEDRKHCAIVAVRQAACAVASLTLILPLVASVRYSTRAWFSVSVRSAMADMVLRASTG